MTEKKHERERDADGQFAPEISKVERKRKPGRPKGTPKTGGRKKGTQNRATRAWKEFVAACADDTELQDALRSRCLDRPDLLLRVAEPAVGKPKETVVVESELKMFLWPGDKDIAEE